jgi:hypothetical protein
MAITIALLHRQVAEWPSQPGVRVPAPLLDIPLSGPSAQQPAPGFTVRLPSARPSLASVAERALFAVMFGGFALLAGHFLALVL